MNLNMISVLNHVAIHFMWEGFSEDRKSMRKRVHNYINKKYGKQIKKTPIEPLI